ncbi:MAG TPA: cytochrome c family protein [Planctomycetota bacterium]
MQRIPTLISTGLAVVVAAAPVLWPQQAAAAQDPLVEEKKTPQETAQFVGAAICRNCHRSPDKGNQYVHWKDKTLHAKAFARLGTEAAKEIAGQQGLGDPREAPECLRCHVTAHDAAPERLARTFKHAWGVQCESCHGPGSYHKEQRVRDPRLRDLSAAEAGRTTLGIPADEILIPTEAVCRSCHNPGSPTYREYDHRTFLPKVAHVNPQRPEPWLPESLPPKKSAEGGGKDASSNGS